jgi:hypothetical protein
MTVEARELYCLLFAIFMLTLYVFALCVRRNRLESADQRIIDDNCDHTRNYGIPIYRKYNVSPQKSKSENWHPQEKRHRTFELVYWIFSAILTTLTVGGAVVSAIFASKALTASWQAVEESRKVTIEARRQAVAAESQLEISKKEARPYIYYSIKGIASIYSWTHVQSEFLALKATWTNFGKQPAILLDSICALAIIFETPDQRVFDRDTLFAGWVPDRDPRADLGDIVISAGESKTFDCAAMPERIPLASRMKDAVKSMKEPGAMAQRFDFTKNHQLWLIGRSRYKDFSGKIRKTTFCFDVEAAGLALETGGGEGCNVTE